MENLVAEGFTADTNKANIGIVDENLKMYRGELDEIRKVKQATPVGDIMGNLGGAANEEFKLYQDNFAGNSRVAVNLTLLGEICDRLGELYKQMNDLARIDSNETNANNIVVVRDQLEMYSNEWVEVAKAQQVLK
jgi:flagellin-specific chaperone FliS